MENIEDIPEEDIVYVDETGIDKYLYQEYAYSYRGEKIYGETSGRKYKRTSIVAAWTNHKIIAPLEYSGTMDSSLFEYWFSGMFLSGLRQGSTVVMDNAAFHRKALLLSFAREQGYYLVFLPPYSPELNPIEKFWSWLKRHLKKILPFLIFLMLLYLSIFKLLDYKCA